MMETIIAIAGAVQLTRCIMALIEALEKPSAPPPDQSKAQRAVTTNHHRAAGTVIIPAAR